MVFICYMTLQDRVIKALYDFMIWSLPKHVAILASLVDIDTVVVEI